VKADAFPVPAGTWRLSWMSWPRERTQRSRSPLRHLPRFNAEARIDQFVLRRPNRSHEWGFLLAVGVVACEARRRLGLLSSARGRADDPPPAVVHGALSSPGP
jgi:hypothetical protein